jgi:hypothetical protein
MAEREIHQENHKRNDQRRDHDNNRRTLKFAPCWPGHLVNQLRVRLFDICFKLRHSFKVLHGRRDSNPQPMVLETTTLPIELHPYCLEYLFRCETFSLIDSLKQGEKVPGH